MGPYRGGVWSWACLRASWWPLEIRRGTGGWGFEARGSNEMPLGLLYELGSWGRTQPFENPAVEVGSMPGSGVIRVSSSRC